jgi:hypothetical protein
VDECKPLEGGTTPPAVAPVDVIGEPLGEDSPRGPPSDAAGGADPDPLLQSGCCHRTNRLLEYVSEAVAAARASNAGPAAIKTFRAFICPFIACEESFPEEDKEAEFQESWRDETRVAVGTLNPQP